MDRTGGRGRSGGPYVWARWAGWPVAVRTGLSLHHSRWACWFESSETCVLNGHPALGAGDVIGEDVSRLPGREVACEASHRLTWRVSTLSSAARVAARSRRWCDSGIEVFQRRLNLPKCPPVSMRVHDWSPLPVVCMFPPAHGGSHVSAGSNGVLLTQPACRRRTNLVGDEHARGDLGLARFVQWLGS